MNQNSGKVMTVRGPIAPQDLGKTLTHEHTILDLLCFSRQHDDPEGAAQFDKPLSLDTLSFALSDIYGMKDNLFITDTELIVRELERFKKAGGGTVCDMTNEDFIQFKDEPGRHWRTLRDMSEAADVHLLCCVGNYIESTHSERAREMTADQLAAHYVDVIQNGYYDTGVKPGQIGEVGVGEDLTPQMEKVLRATAIASVETGLSATIHINASAWKDDFKVLDILEDAGADLNRMAISHRDANLTRTGWDFDDAVAHCAAIMDRGAYVAFDACGNFTTEILPYGAWINPSDRDRCRAILKLIIRGYGERLLVSMDASQKHRFTSYGGYCFTYLLDRFHDICMLCGIPEQCYTDLLVNNPKRLLTIA